MRASTLAFALFFAVSVPIACDHSDNFPGVTGPVLVELQTAESQYDVGETVIVEITIANAENVGSVPFHLRFDGNVLSYLPPAEEGPFMSEGGAITTVFLASVAGGGGELIVGLSRVGTARGADGAGVLARFHFEAVSAGSSGFAFTGAAVKDPQAMNLPAAFSVRQVTIL